MIGKSSVRSYFMAINSEHRAGNYFATVIEITSDNIRYNAVKQLTIF